MLPLTSTYCRSTRKICCSANNNLSLELKCTPFVMNRYLSNCEGYTGKTTKTISAPWNKSSIIFMKMELGPVEHREEMVYACHQFQMKKIRVVTKTPADHY